MRRTAVALQVVVTLVLSVLAIRAAGGSSSAMILQGIAGAVGAVAALVVTRFARPPGRVVGLVLLAAALLIEAFILVAGVPMEGVRRWILVGSVQVHAASLLIPVVVWIAAQRLDAIAAALLVGILVVMAAQPDAAAVDRSNRLLAAIVGAVGAGCAIWALSRHDPLPAVGHVELVVRRTLEASPSLGVLAAVALISVPTAMLWRRRAIETQALAAAWAGFVLANLVANYPAPVIGAGASPVLGWLLSIGLSQVTLLPAEEGTGSNLLPGRRGGYAG
jgi:hypothetical protein